MENKHPQHRDGAGYTLSFMQAACTTPCPKEQTCCPTTGRNCLQSPQPSHRVQAGQNSHPICDETHLGTQMWVTAVSQHEHPGCHHTRIHLLHHRPHPDQHHHLSFPSTSSHHSYFRSAWSPFVAITFLRYIPNSAKQGFDEWRDGKGGKELIPWAADHALAPQGLPQPPPHEDLLPQSVLPRGGAGCSMHPLHHLPHSSSGSADDAFISLANEAPFPPHPQHLLGRAVISTPLPTSPRHRLLRSLWFVHPVKPAPSISQGALAAAGLLPPRCRWFIRQVCFLMKL